MADVFKDTITCVRGDETFVFRVPSPREYGKLAIRARLLRGDDGGPIGATEWGLDMFTTNLFRGMALFELLLIKADATNNWPFTQSESGIKVDSNTFPPFTTRTLVEVYEDFDKQLAAFLSGGSGNNNAHGAEAVASQPNPE